jgi:phenylacetate-coenzyme A ligase PaaK-like adenylate-forming protein
VATRWASLNDKQLHRLQDQLVAQQVQHVVGPFSPYWKQRFAEIGRKVSSIDSTRALETLPAAGERDIAPDGNPTGMARLVVQSGEGGFTLHASGPTLRHALRLRLTRRDAYTRVITSETKPTSYVWSGLGFRYPIASTRADLDVVARAGVRMWRVAGLTRFDALLSAVPVASTTEHVALSYAALASGAPALFPGSDPAAVVAAARLAKPTVIAVPSRQATPMIAALISSGVELDTVHTVLLVGSPTAEQRADVSAQLPSATVLAVHAPAGARILWSECRERGANGGFHTYPDLEVVQTVDPDSGQPTTGGGELVLTQLGLSGSALLRWRTGDVTGAAIDATACPGCGRRVPRITDVRPGALVLVSDDGRTLDLRSVAGAMAGRTDLVDWRVAVGRRGRDDRGQVVVHFVPSGDPGEAAVGAATDIREVAGLLPTQLVAASAQDIAALAGDRLTPHILVRS